jgi:ribosome-binding factor A
MAENRRQRRLGELIQRELATIFLHYSEEPLLTKVTILGTEVAPDLSAAKIFFSVFDLTKLDATLAVIHKKVGHIRHSLAQKVNLRITPHLTFIYDDTATKGQQLSELIDAAIASDEKAHQKTNDEI